MLVCVCVCVEDGAYLVRDSKGHQVNQPFTLMVYYQDKVYNIQIRQQNQQFLLGTGRTVHEVNLRSPRNLTVVNQRYETDPCVCLCVCVQSFPLVSGIINHYSQSPLLLIDAKNRSSSQQNQCLLSEPAGYCMTGQNWS